MRMRVKLSIMAIAILANTTGAIAAERIVFQLGWLPGGQNAPAFLAREKGLFAEAGLEVEILAGRGASDTLTKVATGAADIGEVGLDVFLQTAAENDLPLKAVMPLFSLRPDAIATTVESGIDALTDLPGRTVATSPFTASNLAWPVVLERAGVDPETVTLQRVDAATLAPMLATGQVDAIIMWRTSAAGLGPLLAEAGKELRILPWADFGYDGYSQSLIASQRMIADRPDVLARFIDVMRVAIEQTVADPDAGVRAMTAALPELDAKALRLQLDAAIPLMVNEITAEDGLGVFHAERVATTWAWVTAITGLDADAVDVSKLVALP